MTTDTNTGFFGHPSGLKTLFFTEMWERMSYYGMRILLVLFMTASLQEGGIGMTVAAASAIYGLYTGSVYFMGLPGGWLSDRLLGGQKAVWYGGIIIMLGHIILAIPAHETFYIGLVFVAVGTGLLKPNIGAMVGMLYSQTDQRRDAGYTIYYMGINIGSMIGYFVCGYLQENVGYHYAFGAAAVGMAIGLIQYKLTRPDLQGVAAEPIQVLSASAQRLTWRIIYLFVATVVVIGYSLYQGWLSFNAEAVASSVSVIFFLVFLAYFAAIYFRGNLNAPEKKSMGALFLICLASICFWSGFEQAGSSLNIFARDYTDRVTDFGIIPTGWFASANAIFIVVLSPFFAALWINLGKRMMEPSYSVKCALGLIIMASGFLVMYMAAMEAASGLKVAPMFLISTYFLHTVGELCLSPVALSAVSKLSPRRFAGQMMGVFVLTYSIGNLLAGLFAGEFNPNQIESLPGLFMQIAMFGIGVGIVLYLLAFKTKYWEKEAEKI